MAALTTSPLAGSRAHCKELGDLLFESSTLKDSDRIPTTLRRNPKMFFEIFEKEKAKMAAAAGPAETAAAVAPGAAGAPTASPAASSAVPPTSATPAGQPPEVAGSRLLVKVTYTKDGLVVKTKRVQMAKTFNDMIASLRVAFGVPTHYIIKLSVHDGKDWSS